MSVGQSGRTLSGNTGASTRSPLNVEISARMPLRDFLVSALARFSHRHLLRIRGCFVVRGGGAILAEQVPPPCSNGGRWFEILRRVRHRRKVSFSAIKGFRNLWLLGIWLEQNVLKKIPFHDRYKEFTDELTNAHVPELCLER
jgi:hypothetical protein